MLETNPGIKNKQTREICYTYMSTCQAGLELPKPCQYYLALALLT